MAMTVVDGGIIQATTAEDLADKEGYAATMDASEEVALADGGEDVDDSIVGVITSIAGKYAAADNPQLATIQISGTAFVLAGEAVTAGDWVTCDISGGSADWMLAPTGKFPKAVALQAGAIGDLVQVTLLGSSIVVRA